MRNEKNGKRIAYLFANGLPLKSRHCNERQWRMFSGISAMSER